MDNLNKFVQSMGGQASADAVKIRELLDGLEEGTVLTYAQISEAIGRDVQQDRSGLNKAIRELRREKGKEFTVARGEGVRLAVSADALTSLKQTSEGFRRKAHRTLKRVRNIDMSGLDQAQRLEVAVRATVVSETGKAHRAPALAKVRQRIVANGTQLGLPENLED